jgi:hypothetical protein
LKNLVLATLLLTSTGAALAASTPASKPEQVVETYIASLTGGRFEEAAAQMDPRDLERFRELLQPVFEIEGKPGEPGPLALLDGVKDAAAAKALSGPAFFNAFLNGLSKLNPAFGASLRTATGELLGSVPEGADTLHFVCRSKAKVGELSLTKMTVVTLHRVSGAWKIALSGEIEGLAETIRQSVLKRKAG